MDQNNVEAVVALAEEVGKELMLRIQVALVEAVEKEPIHKFQVA